MNKILEDKNDLKIFNLGLGQGISVLQLINIYQDINDLKFNYAIGDRRLGDIPVCYADNKFAKQELGWQPIFSHKDMCLHAFGWMKHKLIKN